MRPEQWEDFKAAARRRPLNRVPVALIVDSPWIPGYVGASHLDYFLDTEVWFAGNLKVARDFPEVTLFPGWWVEYGMAIEPSALGNRIHFHKDQPPGQTATLVRLEDVKGMAPANPLTDGLMPFALRLYEKHLPAIRAAGHTVPVVTARGPLCLASFLRGVTQFMIDVVEDPEGAHALLELSTATVIGWLKAQAEVIGDSVEGIFVLDDIPGMLSRRLYREFAHPYLERICAAFPPDWVKVYHNDANVRPFLADLAVTGFDVLNWSHNVDVCQAMQAVGGRMCLMGNVAPLDVGVRGTAEEVEQAAAEVLRKAEGQGIILSVGGGVSPGMPAENVRALVAAAKKFSA